jgi:hypothetical protein
MDGTGASGTSQLYSRADHVHPTDSKIASTSAVQVQTGGGYYYAGQNALGTSATLTNGALRLAPFYLPIACTFEALWAEFTVAGDAASFFATCVYSDNGSGYPRSKLITGLTISTGTGNAGSVTTGAPPIATAGSCLRQCRQDCTGSVAYSRV